MTSWRPIGLLAAVFALVVCRPGREVDSRAAPVDAGRPPDAAVPARPAPKPPERLAPVQCPQLKQRVERALEAAQTCKSDGECEMATFDYAFRPCGMGLRTGADLAAATADAKLYRERCKPVLRPVRCAHATRALCKQRRCVLAPPGEK